MSDCCIKIEVLDQGYEVKVPDYAEMAKMEAAAKKNAKGKGAEVATPYMGDCCKEYAVTTIPEVMKLVKDALNNAMTREHDAAFAEASAETD